MAEKVKVIVTGDHDFTESSVVLSDGRTVEWRELNLLRFEKVAIENEFFESLEKNPPHWILFTSPRSVEFFTQALLEHAMDLPTETQVATIGEVTASVAGEHGYSPDFYPTEPGSECFIQEFKDLISNHPDKPRVLIPQAANGRTYLKEKLEELGCQVTVLPLYRTLSVEEAPAEINDQELKEASLVLFTSPSSFIAFQKHYKLPKNARVGAIGKYTFDFLLQNGLPADLLPGGEFRRVGEILC